MSKPKIGQEVRYTELGKGAYYQLNKSWPKNNGVIGKVASFTSEGRILAVKTETGDTEYFIWIFANGMNDPITWDGKE